MIRRHFFLVGALVVLVLVIVAGGLKIIFTPHGPAGGGGPASAAQSGPPGAGRAPVGPGRAGGRGGGGAPTVTPVAAIARDFTDRIDVLGVAKGRQSVTLSSATQQLATRVLFSPGDYVRRGQVLVELQATAEDASILSARAHLNQATRDFQRWNELARRGVAPRATADQYQAAYESARADLTAAQARRSDRSVRAPFSGRVGITDIAPGALINPGAPIVTLDDISTIRVDFEVPDRYLPFVHPGATISARADAYPDLHADGRIQMLDSRIDERTRAITARAEFPNPTGQLLPGMLMRVGVVLAQRQSVAVPESAVQFDGDQAFVYILQRGERGMRSVRRQVVIGINQDGFIEIRSGLAANEQVAGDGLNRLQSGQPVTIAGQGPGGGGRGAHHDGGGPGAAPARPGAPAAAPPARAPG